MAGLLVGKLAALEEHHVRIGYGFSYGEECTRGRFESGIVFVRKNINEPCLVGLFRRGIVIFNASDQHRHYAFAEIRPTIKGGLVNFGRQQICQDEIAVARQFFTDADSRPGTGILSEIQFFFLTHSGDFGHLRFQFVIPLPECRYFPEGIFYSAVGMLDFVCLLLFRYLLRSFKFASSCNQGMEFIPVALCYGGRALR